MCRALRLTLTSGRILIISALIIRSSILVHLPDFTGLPGLFTLDMDPQASQTRQQIIQSLFSRRGPDGSLEETYIAHLKVWEDAPDDAARPPGGGGGKSIEDVAGKKARYLMLAGEFSADGSVWQGKMAEIRLVDHFTSQPPGTGLSAQSQAERQHDVLKGQDMELGGSEGGGDD